MKWPMYMLVTNCSDNVLLPYGTKTLPEPMFIVCQLDAKKYAVFIYRAAVHHNLTEAFESQFLEIKII